MKNFNLSLSTVKEFIRLVYEMLGNSPGEKWYVNITKKPKKRSLPANGVYYIWLTPISKSMGLLYPEARRYIKLTFGLPILFSTPTEEMSSGVLALFNSLGKSGFFSWDYESQLEEMDSRQVTSLMNTKQHSQMREQMQIFYANEFGLNLEYKK